MATFNKNDFIQLLLDHQVLKFGEFTLKSGRVSPYFNAGLLASGYAVGQLSSARRLFQSLLQDGLLDVISA